MPVGRQAQGIKIHDFMFNRPVNKKSQNKFWLLNFLEPQG